jgi:hypothetical protein
MTWFNFKFKRQCCSSSSDFPIAIASRPSAPHPTGAAEIGSTAPLCLQLLRTFQAKTCRCRTADLRQAFSLWNTPCHGQPTRSTRRSGRVPPGPAMHSRCAACFYLVPRIRLNPCYYTLACDFKNDMVRWWVLIMCVAPLNSARGIARVPVDSTTIVTMVCAHGLPCYA